MKHMCLVRFLFSCLLADSVTCALAQTRSSRFYSSNDVQYGLSIKATVLIDSRRQHPNPYFRLGADVGMASTFIDDWLYPAINVEFQLYNGGLGTRNRDGHNYGADFEMLPAFTLTAGCPDRVHGTAGDNREVSLYYFSNFARPALLNPYRHSVSFGTIFCLVTDSAKKSQRIGFLDFNIAGGLQFSYYNDGSVPFEQTAAGDGYDRFHTGGGLLSYNGPSNTLVNTVELAYHKYTGFSQSAFEASNKLFLAFMDYHDPEQKEFNRSQFDLSVSNPYKGYGLQAQWYNSVRADLQHDIHTAVLDTYHMVPYTPPYLTFGLTYYGLTQQGGNR
jgi:hypothetical protein